LSKLVKKQELNYTHARKSLPVAPSEELVALGKTNLLTKFDKKSDEKRERYRGRKPKSELNRKQIEAHARLLLPVLLAIELSLRCQMCDLHFKFEEDRTAVAIEDDRYFI